MNRRIWTGLTARNTGVAQFKRFMSKGTIDSTLAKTLLEEKDFEIKENSEKTDWIQEFTSNSSWKIHNIAGSKEVSLVRKFGNEKITAIFSTDSLEDQEDFGEMEDETSANADQEEVQDSSVAVSIIVEKTDSVEGALELSTTLQGDSFYIDNVAYAKSASLALDQTAEGDWKRRGLYSGPVFADMDEGVVESFHQYIEERGFDKTLAEFISDYIVYKEQTEYVSWLESVSKFISK